MRFAIMKPALGLAVLHLVAVPRAVPRMTAPINPMATPALLSAGLRLVSGLDPVSRDVLCAGTCAAGAIAWVGLWSFLATSGAVSPKVSRKCIHMGSAPIFVLVWPFFSDAPSARVIAALVPLLNAARLVLAARADGAGGAGLVQAVSRSGDRLEVLRGPLFYVGALLLATLVSWRGSPVGVLALAQMAVGDGAADIVGRKLGASNRWPFAPTKSVAGSVAFFTCALAASYGLIGWLHAAGCLALNPADVVVPLIAISAACTAVELLPGAVVDDNISVPLLAAILAKLLLP